MRTILAVCVLGLFGLIPNLRAQAPDSLAGITIEATITLGSGLLASAGSYEVTFTSSHYTLRGLSVGIPNATGRYQYERDDTNIRIGYVWLFNIIEQIPALQAVVTFTFHSHSRTGNASIRLLEYPTNQVFGTQNIRIVYTNQQQPDPPDPVPDLAGWLWVDRYPYVYSHTAGKWFYLLPKDAGLWIADLETQQWALID